MSAWLYAVAAKYPELVRVESYGKSHAGRDLLLATITEIASGEHATKPAHWIDANIHSTEVTSGVAAMYVIQYLVGGYCATCKDEVVVKALRTRVFYVAPRVNPDGVEDALDDRPSFHRSSVRHWPYHDGHRWPGLQVGDVYGDGRILTIEDRRSGRGVDGAPRRTGSWSPSGRWARRGAGRGTGCCGRGSSRTTMVSR